MSWLTSVFVAVLSGVLGLIVAGLVTATLSQWLNVSNREGAAGYLMIFMALIGGAVGFGIGLAVSRVVASMVEPGFLKAAGISGGAVLALGGIALLLGWLRADFAPKMDGQSLELAIEVRCPNDFSLPKTKDEYGAYACVYLPGGRRQMQGNLQLDQARQVDGRWIVTAKVPLDTSASRKYLEARFDKENNLTFGLPLRSHPSRSDLEWSQWVDSGWDAGKPEPPKEKKFNLRYKVQLVAPPPPVPTADEEEAKIAAEDQAKFDALGDDTPIQDWFPFAQKGGVDPARRATAIRHITARPGYATELAALMLNADDDVVKEALYLVADLPVPPPSLLTPVAAAGKQIAGMIRKFNATTEEQDPNYYGAASVSVRFSAWMDAARTLREKSGGDFTSELGEILKLSRVRTDSVVMQGDVRRVASYYMKQWANLEPLPGDPPPR